jgi:hypothetical protein
MDWLEILNEIFQVCIIPLLGILTAVAVKYIQAKAAEIATNQENAVVAKYVTLLADTITDCVVATNQTYVNNLKERNAFDEEAQIEAFRRTYESVMAVLSADAKEYLTHIYGDLSTYITNRIEAEVHVNR